MNFDDLHKMIADSTISDEEIYQAIKVLVADRFDDLGSIIPMTKDEVEQLDELGTLMNDLSMNLCVEHIKVCLASQAMKKKSEA